MARLIFTSGEFAGRSYGLVAEATTVGRGDANTLVIQDASVSQRHCEILCNGSEVIVRDLGSSNGTLVHGIRVRNGQRQLLSGQEVQIGSVAARLELDEWATSDTTTDVTAIHAYARYCREHEAEAATHEQQNRGMTLESDAPSGEHTFMLARLAAPEAGAAVPAVAATRAAPDIPSRFRRVLVGVALALGSAASLWWFFGRD